MGFPFSRLKAVILFLGQPPGIAALISIGFHGVLFTAGPTFSSVNSSRVGSPLYGIPQEVPLVELTPQEQGQLPDFSSPFATLPDFSQGGTLNSFDDLLDPGSGAPASDIPEDVITRYDQSYLPPFSPPPYSPPFVWEPRQNSNSFSPFPNTVFPENVSPAPTTTPETPAASTPTTASTPGTASPHISASTPAVSSTSAIDRLPSVGYQGLTAANLLPRPEEPDSSSAEEPPSSQEGGEQTNRGASPPPNIPNPLLAWRESLNYNPENTAVEAAETAQTEWLSALKETAQDPGLAVTETIALPLTYKNSICLDPQPDSGLVGFWLAPTPEDQTPLEMLKSTGYPFLNRQMLEYVANAVVEMDLSQAPGNAVYLFDISFSMEPNSCRTREEILPGARAD